MKPVFSLMLGCCFLAQSTPVWGAATNLQPTAATLERLREKHQLPALAAVVVKDGRICDRAAVGVRKFGETATVTTNDLWHIGSCTKSMTATLAAMLIEAGQLKWDTTIADTFPELKGRMAKAYESVTLEQLLTHRGGFPTSPPGAAWRRAWEEKGTPTEQRREFVTAVLNQPPEAPPGTKKTYSNQGYAVAGAMIEKITGKAYESLLTEKLFAPLEMKSAGFGPPGSPDGADQPWGHARKTPVLVPSRQDNPPAITPAGRVHCSLDDLARYVMFHLRKDGQAGLLKADSMARLHTPPAGGDYAAGWVVANRDWAGGPALVHNGSNTLWYVVMWLAPEKNFAVIIATNVGGPDATKGCDEAVGAMIQQWLPK